MNYHRLSVVVTIHNGEEFLERCLESLVHQTCGNIEIIAVNEASVDGSQKILDSYSKRYDNIKVIEIKDNHGPGHCRNIGIDVASGDLIGFIDCDDWLD